MTLLPLILVLVTTQLPCGPREFSDTCKCKQGVATACEALRQTDKKLADALEAAANQAVRAVVEASNAQGTEEPGSQVKEAAQASYDAPEPPDCKGQKHHIISKPIARELNNHRILQGAYKARDPRLVAQAKDEEAHCGYQQWHRDVDDEVIEWLKMNKTATSRKFEDFLREIYARPEMRARFPHGF